MNIDEIFHPIDMKEWAMAQEFYYYSKIAPTSYSLTVQLDVTNLRRKLKEQGKKFFPAYLYLCSHALCDVEQMRVGVKDGVVGHWDYLTPTYPQFHDDTKSTTLLWTEYDKDFGVFYDRYIYDTKTYGDDHGMITRKGAPPANSYVISCMPWLSFTAFGVHNHGIKDYYVPSFEAGAFEEKDGKIFMPLSMTVHHATTEGYHIKCFLEKMREYADNTEVWLK